ncbi:MAG: CHAP domain-containing protein [Clostridia bacterium]|nr:CHAP domain-containing protein [Clostridia bacterium]
MKRLFAVGCISLTLLCTATTPLAALTPTYTVTGTYQSSQYYKNLQMITKTGDAAFDTVAAALSQTDYHEGNSKTDFDGKNGSGTKNYTEYNRAIGTINGSYSYAWCAAFASWCLDVAGARNSAGGRFTSCTLWVERLQELGLYSKRASGYIPKTGDLIFFRSADTTRASDHVGLVRYVKDGRVYTVEGNSSNKVSLRDYSLTDTYIVGYGKPQYGGETLSQTLTEMEDTAAGLYMVTNDFVNVRAAASQSSVKLGVLYRGTLTEVTEIADGWGRITYNGKTAYISLDYADFVTPVFYTVQYAAEEAENCPPKSSYFSFEQTKVSDTVPLREGYLFAHWQDAKGNNYAAGDTLPQGNLTLSAVFTPIPVVEETPEELPVPETPAPDGEGENEHVPGAGAPEEETPITPAPGHDERASRAAAEAGTVSGVLAAVAGIWWYVRKMLI